MSPAETYITKHLDTWTSAIKAKSSAGRGGGKKQEFYGIKKLRELILELAIKGNLVRNDPADVPISYDSRKSRNSLNNTSPPENWRTILLSDGIENRSGNSKLIKGKLYGEPAADLYQGFSASGADVWCEDFEYEGEAIIISAVGARCGKAFRATGKWSAIANTNITRPDPALFVIDFAYLVLNNEHFWVRGGSAQPFVKFPPSLNRYFSLPPLAEQHRIVAKVNELMALCDQLEQQQEDSERTHDNLVKTLLGALTSASEHGAFAEAWQRIASHFDILFITESSIDRLKQTILQLAVMGKLVKHDPENEPADVLLKRIASEQKPLSVSRKGKKKAIGGETLEQFAIPDSWSWCQIWEIAEQITSGSRDWAKHYSESGPIFVTMGNLSRGDYRLRMETLRHVQPPKSSEGSRTKLQEGDLLISITGEVGNLGLIPKNFGEAYINQHTCLLRFVPECRNRYFAELLRSPWAQYQFDAPQRGIKNSFRLPDVGEMLIPIPPLAEQHRIVAKVDELMAVCDRLKASLKSTHATQLDLADTLVEGAIQ